MRKPRLRGVERLGLVQGEQHRRGAVGLDMLRAFITFVGSIWA
ncbi:hypothetical protein ACFXKR_13055 [Streptomyces violascens]